MKSIIYTFITLFLLSCNKDPQNEEESIVFSYQPRTCEHLIVSNYYRIDVGFETGNSRFDNTFRIEPLIQKSISASNYLFNIGIGSFNKDIAANIDFNPNDYLTEPDVYMEQQIGQYLNKKKEGLTYSDNPHLHVVDIEYRLTEIKTVKISSTDRLFEREVGYALNNQIEIFGTPTYHDFLFTYDKQLIGSIQQGMSLDRYLSYRPIASASLYMRFTSVPPEAPLETRFVIEMEMDNGKILRDTTDTVTLLP